MTSQNQELNKKTISEILTDCIKPQNNLKEFLLATSSILAV